SGNWIKIVQRLPVRIGLDPRELDRNPLRVGLSVTVTVDTRDHSGPPVARAAPAVPFQSETNQDAGPQVEAQIARIVADNRGSGVRS
ncbi:MAG TPA: EmrA/EmrK family multidrug efflux transporter periplasmic adaptor subunit, partial [Acetobacteraceae bacterium]|nr:EmrA/EmrK family multidrug efflux transporter periplasmic adaptor subunit [Acetobacteraceae bacterium]